MTWDVPIATPEEIALGYVDEDETPSSEECPLHPDCEAWR